MEKDLESYFVEKETPEAIPFKGEEVVKKKLKDENIPYYCYTKLEELLDEEKDRVNLYGVILDSSAPYYIEKAAKYVCTMKLIDQSVPGILSKEPIDFIALTIFANIESDLPVVTKVGSIIRIHRGQSKKYKGKQDNQLQINCDVGIKGAWILFDPLEGIAAISKSGKKYSFTPNDIKKLKSLREFGKAYFGENELSSITLSEAAANNPKDFDTIVYVEKIKKKEKHFRVSLRDPKKVVKLDVPFHHNFPLRQNEVIRLRSANYKDDNAFKFLTLNVYSNLLLIPKIYKSAQVLLEGMSIDPKK